MASSIVLLGAISGLLAQELATGTVFEDRNGNGRQDSGERGLANIRVSNGRDVVLTDRNGRFELEIDGPAVVFISPPSTHAAPLDDRNIPQLAYVHYPEGTPVELRYGGMPATGPLPESIDFPLIPDRSPRNFRVLLFGDTQPRTMEEVWFNTFDSIQEVIGKEAAFGVTLGDIVFDDLTLLDPLAQMKAHIGMPWHYVIGNHDLDLDAPEDRYSTDTWQRVFGPKYYSFDYGQVHFVVLDNIFLIEPNSYNSALGDDQVTWLENNLATVPRDRTVVLLMHIPLMQTRERETVYELLAPYRKSLSFSAHTHTLEQHFIGEEQGLRDHLHVIAGAVCGSWWRGELDELGIPHSTMRDGTPRGYVIADFRGGDVELTWKNTRRPNDYQMNLHAPEEVVRAEGGVVDLYANVFFANARTKVEFRLNDGDWQDMELVNEGDPYYLQLKALEEAGTLPASGRSLPNAAQSRHLYRADLDVSSEFRGVARIEVRSTDMYGRTYHSHRLILVR